MARSRWTVAAAMGNGGARNGKTNPMGKAAAMGGKARWTAVVITMDGSSKIAMDCGSGD